MKCQQSDKCCLLQLYPLLPWEKRSLLMQAAAAKKGKPEETEEQKLIREEQELLRNITKQKALKGVNELAKVIFILAFIVCYFQFRFAFCKGIRVSAFQALLLNLVCYKWWSTMSWGWFWYCCYTQVVFVQDGNGKSQAAWLSIIQIPVAERKSKIFCRQDTKTVRHTVQANLQYVKHAAHLILLQ